MEQQQEDPVQQENTNKEETTQEQTDDNAPSTNEETKQEDATPAEKNEQVEEQKAEQESEKIEDADSAKKDEKPTGPVNKAPASAATVKDAPKSTGGYFDKENIYPHITKIDISESMDEFYKIRKHFLIFTEAGKPVYSRHGDEMNLAPFIATMSAIIPKLQTYFWDNRNHASQVKNRVKTFKAKNFTCVFIKKGALIYVALTSERKLDVNANKYLDDPDSSSFVPVKDSVSFIQTQLEYLHLQLISLTTANLNQQLQQRPNLDIKSTISGLERTLDMMIEVSSLSPQCFLQAYQPLRMPANARLIFNQCVSQHPKPENFAYGMIVTSMNVLTVFADEFNVKPHDVTIIMNYIYANSSMKSGETWTPICVPGLTEQHILYVYIRYFTPNLGLILVCTDHSHECFFNCQKYSKQVYEEIELRQNYGSTTGATLGDLVDKCTKQMYEQFNMKEIQMVIIRNNVLNQFTTYNYPLLSKVTSRQQQTLRIFEQLYVQAEVNEDNIQPPQSQATGTANQAADITPLKRHADSTYKLQFEDYTYAMVNSVSAVRDYSLFICYDHRKNNELSKISKFLLDDIKQEEKNCFIMQP